MAGGISPITFSNFTGIDFNTIIASIVAAAKIPEGSLNSEISGENLSISQLGLLSGDFTSLQNSLNQIAPIATSPPQLATVSSGAPFSASVTGAPIAGNYLVSIDQLATAQAAASQGYASDTNTVGTGTITITPAGGPAQTITINSSNDTLDGVAGAINAADVGVTAQVVNTGLPGAPFRLEVTSNSTGSSGAFTVGASLAGGTAPDFAASEIGPVSLDSVSGTSAPSVGGTYTGSLTQGYHFTVTSGGTIGTDPITIAYRSDSGESGSISVPGSYVAGSPLAVADGLTLSLGAGTLATNDQFSVAAFNPTLGSAQDAKVQVGSQIVTSASNIVTNAIPGLTLALSATGGSANVSVTTDSNSQANAISNFVSAYDKLTADIGANTQALPNLPAPPLASNGAIESAGLGLSLSLGTVNLSKLGITVDDKTGQLSFDSSAFAAALAADPTGVQSAISSLTSGLSPIVAAALTPTTGLVAAQTTSYQALVTQQTAQINQISTQINSEQTQLEAEFGVLQAQIAQEQSIQTLFSIDNSTSSSTSTTPAPGSNLTLSA